MKNLVRDRLYCTRVGSEEHIRAQFTLDTIGCGLARLLAPLLPHLAAEFVSYHPRLKQTLANCLEHLLAPPTPPPSRLFNGERDANALVEFTQRLRSLIATKMEAKGEKLDYQKMVRICFVAGDRRETADRCLQALAIEYSDAEAPLIDALQTSEFSLDSPLIELLGVSSIRLARSTTNALAVRKCSTRLVHCIRCRKLSRSHEQRVCDRCAAAIA